mmetsp:Transcript_12002/g.28704  ORF Transcript_12002/g.28704 Transcript_12002/m.28704 type:complete len:245 (+) Transcript_12002:423-1157(+)
MSTSCWGVSLEDMAVKETMSAKRIVTDWNLSTGGVTETSSTDWTSSLMMCLGSRLRSTVLLIEISCCTSAVLRKCSRTTLSDWKTTTSTARAVLSSAWTPTSGLSLVPAQYRMADLTPKIVMIVATVRSVRTNPVSLTIVASRRHVTASCTCSSCFHSAMLSPSTSPRLPTYPTWTTTNALQSQALYCIEPRFSMARARHTPSTTAIAAGTNSISPIKESRAIPSHVANPGGGVSFRSVVPKGV